MIADLHASVTKQQNSQDPWDDESDDLHISSTYLQPRVMHPRTQVWKRSTAL